MAAHPTGGDPSLPVPSTRRGPGRLLTAGLLTVVLGACSAPEPDPGPAPEPEPAGVTVGSEVVFTGDYETGDFSQWTQCQNREYSDPCDGYDGDFYGARIVDDEVRQGRYAARFEVRNGDDPSWGGGERSEVSRYGTAKVHEGDERWYEFSMKFADDFPSVKENFFIVMQWHAGDHSSPPMAVEVDRKDRLVLTDNTVEPSQRKVIGRIARGEWVDYVVHAQFSRDREQGWAEVFQDGRLALPRQKRATMTTDSNYLKMGIYRAKRERSTAVLWQDGLRVTAPGPVRAP